MAPLRCPICGHDFEATYSVAMPFCSERCRQIDLGKWLDEEHSMPLDIEGSFEEQANPSQSDDSYE